MLIAGIIFFLLAIPLGLVILFVYRTGPWTIPLGALGIFLAYSYSNPPLKASYRGLGELFTMLGYGALLFTAYYIQAGFSWLPIIVGLPFLVLPPGKYCATSRTPRRMPQRARIRWWSSSARRG